MFDAVGAIEPAAAAPEEVLVWCENDDAHEAALNGLVGEVGEGLPAIAVEEYVEPVLASCGVVGCGGCCGRCGATRDAGGCGEKGGWGTNLVSDGKTAASC